MKHFMCTHTFSSEDAWARSSNPDTVLTDRQFFELLNKDKARVLQHCEALKTSSFVIGKQKTEDIHEVLEEVGMAGNMITIQEMHRFVTLITSPTKRWLYRLVPMKAKNDLCNRRPMV